MLRAAVSRGWLLVCGPDPDRLSHSVCWPWVNAIRLTTGFRRGAIAIRTGTYQLHGLHGPIGREVMNHVAEPRKSPEPALGYLLVQSSGLATDIDDLVVSARHDRDRQLQVAVAPLQLRRSR